MAVKTNDRWLSEFTRRVFQAGFSWKVVDAKWDGFETAFWGFDPGRCSRLDMDDMEALTADKGIVRNPQKIKSVSQNAEMVLGMAAQSGSADKFIRDWPSDNFISLLDYLNTHGSRLGPNTACYALRFSGVPSFILSKDVTAALIHAQVVDKAPTGKAAKKAVQAAFNIWVDESGEDLSFVSRVLAHSIEG
jgi:3-methyladenine DNA glycosylase Tag